MATNLGAWICCIHLGGGVVVVVVLPTEGRVDEGRRAGKQVVRVVRWSGVEWGGVERGGWCQE